MNDLEGYKLYDSDWKVGSLVSVHTTATPHRYFPMAKLHNERHPRSIVCI